MAPSAAVQHEFAELPYKQWGRRFVTGYHVYRNGQPRPLHECQTGLQVSPPLIYYSYSLSYEDAPKAIPLELLKYVRTWLTCDVLLINTDETL